MKIGTDGTMTELDTLQALEWATKHFGSLATNRQARRRDVLRVVARGLAESIGEVELCDGDGFRVEPQRLGEGFVLTDAGKARLIALKAAYRDETEGVAQ